MPSVYRGVQDAPVSISTGGGNQVIAATAGKSIRVLSAVLLAAGETTITFETSGAGTSTGDDLTGPMAIAANGGFCLPHNPLGWFQADEGEALDIRLSAAVSVAGVINYVLV